MAILSKTLYFSVGIWQLISDKTVVGQKDPSSTLEIVNADALPVGDIQAAKTISGSSPLHFPAPALGSLYGRVRNGEGSISFYEVT